MLCGNLVVAVIEGKDVSYVCLYDFDDYMNEQEAVDKEVIDASKETHTHQLYQFELVEM